MELAADGLSRPRCNPQPIILGLARQASIHETLTTGKSRQPGRQALRELMVPVARGGVVRVRSYAVSGSLGQAGSTLGANEVVGAARESHKLKSNTNVVVTDGKTQGKTRT